jgi:putative aldouronate transport system permease protein
MAQATVAVIALFYAVRMWNEWFNPSLFISSKTKYPLQLLLREILLKNDTKGMTQLGSVGQSQQESFRLLVKYCTIMVATIPILLVYPFLQRYFIQGIMIGSVKG